MFVFRFRLKYNTDWINITGLLLHWCNYISLKMCSGMGKKLAPFLSGQPVLWLYKWHRKPNNDCSSLFRILALAHFLFLYTHKNCHSQSAFPWRFLSSKSIKKKKKKGILFFFKIRKNLEDGNSLLLEKKNSFGSVVNLVAVISDSLNIVANIKRGPGLSLSSDL